MARMMQQDLGDGLEDAVKAGAELYLTQRLVRLGKVATPIAQLTRVQASGAFTARYERKAHVDYYGVFLERAGEQLRGRAIALECKATLEPRFTYSSLRPQQRDWLNDTPLAFVLVHFVTAGGCRLIPWSAFKAGASVKPADGWPVDAVNCLAPVLDGRAK